MGAGRQAEARERGLEERLPGGVGPSVLPDLLGRHQRVAARAVGPEARCLYVARRDDALADGCRRLGVDARVEGVERDRRDLDVEVDAVEQRARHTRQVAQRLPGRADAGAPRVAGVSARTGIH